MPNGVLPGLHELHTDQEASTQRRARSVSYNADGRQELVGIMDLLELGLSLLL